MRLLESSNRLIVHSSYPTELNPSRMIKDISPFNRSKSDFSICFEGAPVLQSSNWLIAYSPSCIPMAAMCQHSVPLQSAAMCNFMSISDSDLFVSIIRGNGMFKLASHRLPDTRMIFTSYMIITAIWYCHFHCSGFREVETELPYRTMTRMKWMTSSGIIMKSHLNFHILLQTN